MNDLDTKYKRKIILRNFFMYIFLTIFLYLSWMFIHELSHVLVCDLFGSSGIMTYTSKDGASVICDSIDKNATNNIVFALAPYFIDFVVITGVYWIRFNKTISSFHNILWMLSYIVLLDIIHNFLSTFFRQTDFLIFIKIIQANWNNPYIVIFGAFSAILIITALSISLDIIKLNIKLIYLKIIEYRNSDQKSN